MSNSSTLQLTVWKCVIGFRRKGGHPYPKREKEKGGQMEGDNVS